MENISRSLWRMWYYVYDQGGIPGMVIIGAVAVCGGMLFLNWLSNRGR